MFFEGFLKLSGVKNVKCTIKDKGNPYVYVYEAYFIEKMNFNENPVLFMNGRGFERGIFKNTEVLKKHGIFEKPRNF